MNRSSLSVYGTTFFTSLAVLAYEITFTRVFAYAQWHNLSSVIITMALLGCGAGGTAVFILNRFISRYRHRMLFGFSLMLPFMMAACFIVSAILPVNPYGITFSSGQVFLIFTYFFLMSLPFFAGSAVVCISLLTERPSGVYALNLSGSGAGAALPLLLSYSFHPYEIMGIVIIISQVPVIFLSSGLSVRYMLAAAAAICLITPPVIALVTDSDFRKISQYKPISGALNLPGAEILGEVYSPLSVVQVVEAEGLRGTSGLSIISPHQVPVQRSIFFDGDSPGAITPFSGDLKQIEFIRHLSSYTPYHLKGLHGVSNVLIIGAGGGESILKALIAGAEGIDAVEVNSGVISLMRGEQAHYSGGIYLNEKVTIHNDDGRSFARKSRKNYDLIEIPMLDAFSSAASGVYALNESYLYTVESFMDFYSRLTPRGIFAVTRWITTPPRDSLKIFNTAAESLKKMNVPEPEKKIIAIRSIQTMTLMVARSSFTDGDIQAVKKFCGARLFELLYYPGIPAGGKALHIRERAWPLKDSLIDLLSDDRELLINSYDSDISAPDDNRPYFYNFFKPAFFRYIVEFGPSQVPVTEWGYLLLVIILIPVAVISFAAILLPVIRSRNDGNSGTGWIMIFFSLIAAGFFFIEMPLIQKMILFLGSPVISLSIIISSLLVFSGIGSFLSDRFLNRGDGILISVIIISAIALFYIIFLDRVLSLLIHLPSGVKIITVIILIAPPAFYMGLPFPKGLALIKKGSGSLIPLAWGVNGFFSVISIISAALCAVIYGYKTVIAAAVIFYLLAGITSMRLTVKNGEVLNKKPEQ